MFQYINIVSQNSINTDSIFLQHNNRIKNYSFENKIKYLHELSLKYYKTKKYNSAIKANSLELQLYKNNNTLNDKYSNALFNSALFYKKNKEFIKSKEQFKKVIKLEINKFRIAKSYCELGEIQTHYGDYENALTYYNNGIKIFKSLEKNESVAKYLQKKLNLLNYFDDSQQINKIPVVLNEFNIIIKKINNKAKKRFYTYFYNNQKAIYLKNYNFNFNKIKSIYFNNLTIAKKYNDTNVCIVTLNNIANLFLTKKSDSTIIFLNQIPQYSSKLQPKILYNFANYYYLIGKYSKSLTYITKYENFIKDNVNNDKLLQLKFKNLKVLNYINLFKKNKDTSNIDLALISINNTNAIIESIKSNKITDRAILFWQKEISNTFFNGVLCSNLLNNTDLAFYYLEKNKASLLIKNIIKSNDSINKIQSLSQIKKTLNKNEVIISFINSTNNKNIIFEFIISKNKTIINQLSKEDISNDITSLSSLLSKPINTKTEQAKFNTISFDLYQSIFPNQISKKIIKGKKLIFSTDGILNNFPFETLITNKQNNDYLVLKHEINYIFSNSATFHSKSINRKPLNEFIGFAPYTFNYNNLEPLFYSKKEIENIGNLFKSKIFIDTLATKKNFTNKSSKYNIIHLATHASDSDIFLPWIAFKRNKINLNEIIDSNIQADLVTLSACNTTNGEIATGEGVLSLARGFISSGANSVVSSLWNVNDKATTNIMIDFYKNLKNGQTKSKALQQAKIDYLNTHSLSEASPYYWASFILIGDAGKLHQIPNNYYWYYYLIGVLVVIIIIIVLIKRLLRRASSQ